jgi:dsRNA-specific ribonuclease
VTVQEATGAQNRFIVQVRVAGDTLGKGEGRSKREAQQAAAQEAILALAMKSKQEG